VDDLIANVDYLIVSKDFSCKLMQDTNLESALRRMQARYNRKLSAATLGEEGVLAWDGRKFYRSAAYKVPVVDTTGAGDIFRRDSSMGCCKSGRWIGCLISPARRRR